jgi:hypothetical protein
MTNRRQIPFLHGKRRADGRWSWHWKPSPRLRQMGWTNRTLGITYNRNPTAEITNQAIALNDELAEWETKGRAQAGPAPLSAPRRWTMGDCIDAYLCDVEFTKNKDSTRREYEVRLRYLRHWAMDGDLRLDQLDTGMVRDLKAELLAPRADGKAASKHRAGAVMRVLRLLCNWAITQGRLGSNPTDHISVPAADARQIVLLPHEVDQAVGTAAEMGLPSLALAFQLALWTLQREGDLLALNRMSWRQIENAVPADAATLANPRGNVMGFRLRQQKTGAWVDCPVPPFLHGPIEEMFARSQWLLPDDLDPARAYPQYLLQRRARKALNAAGLERGQFRDLRRSGMTMLGDLGGVLQGITAISGHAVLGKKTILDTYMPPNTSLACATIATALRTLQARENRGQMQ